MMHLVVQFTLTVYQYTEKEQKLRKINCIGSLYHFSITHTNHSFYLYVWFDFFQTFMSTTSSPSTPVDNQGGTVPVSEVFSDPVQIAGFTGKSSLKVKLKQEEGVQGPKVYQYLYITFMVVRKPFFTVNCLQEVHKFCTHSNIMHINKVHKYYMYLALK